jgi:hypothetical protein
VTPVGAGFGRIWPSQRAQLDAVTATRCLVNAAERVEPAVCTLYVTTLRGASWTPSTNHEIFCALGPVSLVRFVRFVYDPGYVTANGVPVTLCDSPGVRCGCTSWCGSCYREPRAKAVSLGRVPRKCR